MYPFIKKKAVAGCALVFIMSGCASMEEFDKNLSAISAATQRVSKSPPRQSSSSGGQQGLSITADQQNQISRELAKKAADARMQALINEASPTIKEFIEKISCLPYETAGKEFAAYAAPGEHLYVNSPLKSTPYHNKSACLTVKKIQGWKSPALNALQFEVIYVAEDSGESTKTNHKIIKQPDGSWLFSGDWW